MSNSQRLREMRARRNGSTPPPAPPTDADLTYPEGVTQADVLLVVGRPPAPGWWETRGRLCVDLLGERDITAACVTLPSPARLEQLIEELRPRLIINRAVLIDLDVTERLARQYPRVKFVAVNHSSIAHFATTPDIWRKHWAYFRLAEQLPNCYLATPDERNLQAALRPDIAGKLVWLPNPVRMTDWTPRSMGEPPTVSLIAAGRPMKNLPTQLLAYGLASRARPMRLLVSTRGGIASMLREACHHLQIDAEFADWQDWPEYQERLQSIDIGLQVSHTESFNYVALEHMLAGVPVVGSSAIRYLPGFCQAPIDDPRAQSQLTLTFIDDWETYSYQARNLAATVAESQNECFQTAYLELLNG